MLLGSQLSGFQPAPARGLLFPSEIVAILQMRGVVILGSSQLDKFIVEKGPRLQHS